MDAAKAVLKALEAEDARAIAYRAGVEYRMAAQGLPRGQEPPVYRWPDRSCASLVRTLCRALGTPEPAYGPWEALPEAKAAAECVRQYGTMGVAHQAGLIETGGWEAVAVKDDDGKTVVPRPGDVVSFEGRVVAADGSEFRPPMEGAQVTGVCGLSGFKWYWTMGGLSTVAAGVACTITRAKACRPVQ